MGAARVLASLILAARASGTTGVGGVAALAVLSVLWLRLNGPMVSWS